MISDTSNLVEPISKALIIEATSSDESKAEADKSIRSTRSSLSKKSKRTSDNPKRLKKQLIDLTRKRKSIKLRYNPTKKEVTAFRDLQNTFRSPTFLVHFDRKRKLYINIDTFKRRGFTTMIYHIRKEILNESIPARADVQLIIFLSKLINAAERNYWPTELEVATIVWVVRKIRHMIEASETPSVIIYTDHSAAVQISRQTTLSTSSIDKLNLRLVRAS